MQIPECQGWGEIHAFVDTGLFLNCARCVHVCVYVPREDIEPPAGGVTRGCEKTDMSARNNLGSSGSGILC